MAPLQVEQFKKIETLGEHIVLIYGRPKIGKTTLAKCFPKPLFLATEPLRTIDCDKMNINSWNAFLEACAFIASGKHEYETILLDTFDNLTMYATEHICREKGIEDIGDYKKFGAYHLVTALLRLKINKLASLGYGFVITSHTKLIAIETKSSKYNMMTIAVSGQNKDVVLNLPDIILYMDSEMRDGVEVGVVRTKPSMYWHAGDRTKRLPSEILFPLDKPEVIYGELAKYFKKGE